VGGPILLDLNSLQRERVFGFQSQESSKSNVEGRILALGECSVSDLCQRLGGRFRSLGTARKTKEAQQQYDGPEKLFHVLFTLLLPNDSERRGRLPSASESSSAPRSAFIAFLRADLLGSRF
jgi:hypothetical protein